MRFLSYYLELLGMFDECLMNNPCWFTQSGGILVFESKTEIGEMPLFAPL